MHRQFSLQPFSRHYSHSTNPFLDFLEVEPPSSSDPDALPRISVTSEKHEFLHKVLTSYKSAQQQGTLLTLSFVTINDYLFLLRAVSEQMSCLGRTAMYYLAAAVSDFFLPSQRLVRRHVHILIAITYANSHYFDSLNIKYNPGRGVYRSRWIRSQKSSNRWWPNGPQRDLLSPSRFATPFNQFMNLD